MADDIEHVRPFRSRRTAPAEDKIDPVRDLIRQRLRDEAMTTVELSRACGKSHAWMWAFLNSRSPKYLNPRAREIVARKIKVPSKHLLLPGQNPGYAERFAKPERPPATATMLENFAALNAKLDALTALITSTRNLVESARPLKATGRKAA